MAIVRVALKRRQKLCHNRYATDEQQEHVTGYQLVWFIVFDDGIMAAARDLHGGSH
jgi:hypothetical protein